MIPIHQVVFYFFATLLVLSSFMLIVSRNPVKALLLMVLAFFCSAVLWMMLSAEFLALMLIFVYVGAVMTLFLFVVMMINVDYSSTRSNLVRYLPYAIVIVVLMVAMMVLILHPQIKKWLVVATLHTSAYSNTKALGTALFEHYLYPFEVAGVILLSAMVSAITLAFFGRKPGARKQNIAKQHQATKAQRLRLLSRKEMQK